MCVCVGKGKRGRGLACVCVRTLQHCTLLHYTALKGGGWGGWEGKGLKFFFMKLMVNLENVNIFYFVFIIDFCLVLGKYL